MIGMMHYQNLAVVVLLGAEAEIERPTLAVASTLGWLIVEVGAAPLTIWRLFRGLFGLRLLSKAAK